MLSKTRLTAITLALFAPLAAIAMLAPSAHADSTFTPAGTGHDTRACVSKREFNGAQPESRAALEARWEVARLSAVDKFPVVGTVTMYPRCGFPMDMSLAWYGVNWSRSTSKGLYEVWHREPGAHVVGRPRTIAAPTDHRVIQLEQAEETRSKLRVTYSEPIWNHRLYVELNDRSTYRFTPCHYEDSVNCWWDAGSQGNRSGHSFVAMAHRGGPVTVLYLDPKYAATHNHVVGGDGYHDNDGAGE